LAQSHFLRYILPFFLLISFFSCTISTEKEEYLNNETDTLFQIFTDSIIQASETKVNRSLLKFEQKISTPQTKYQEVMLELASLYSLKEKGEIDTAAAGFEKVVALLKLREEPRLKRKLLDINLTLGTIYLYGKNDMQKALPNFLEAKSLSEKYGNIYQQAEVNKYLGYVYFRQSNAIDARKSFANCFECIL
jgi:tetratricopeptide (TPR) repeat protein